MQWILDHWFELAVAQLELRDLERAITLMPEEQRIAVLLAVYGQNLRRNRIGL